MTEDRIRIEGQRAHANHGLCDVSVTVVRER